MISIGNIYNEGFIGQFRGNDELLGWKGANGGEPVIHSASSVRQVGLSADELKICCECDNGDMTVLTMRGFVEHDFDQLLHYFQQNCGVHIQMNMQSEQLASVPDKTVGTEAVQPQKCAQIEEPCERLSTPRVQISGQKSLDPLARAPLQLTPRASAQATPDPLSRPPPQLTPRGGAQITPDPLSRNPLQATPPKPATPRNYSSNDPPLSKPLPPPKASLNDDCPMPKPLPAPRVISEDDCPMPKPLPAPKATSEVNEERYGSSVSLLDGKPFVDEEVSDPNSMSAAPPGQKNKRNSYIRSDSILEGWVWKRSRFLHKWRRRWLVLTSSGLETYADRSNAKSTEFAASDALKEVYAADGEIKAVKCFCVVNAKRSWYLVCDDDAQKQEWIMHVARVIARRPQKR